MTAEIERVEGYNPAKDRAVGDRWVSMTNALVRAGQGLTLAEKRLVTLAISRFDSAAPWPADRAKKSRIAASEYAEAFGVDSTTAYEALNDASKKLFEKKITFFVQASQRKVKDEKIQMRWVSSVRYQSGEGWVELHWTDEILPALTSLKKNFTTYQLKQATALRSIYSWRMLELLVRFKRPDGTGIAEYTIEDFTESMGATEKQKKDFAAIRRRILDPAIEELRRSANGLTIEYKTVKAGRRVKALRFFFRENRQGSFDFEGEEARPSVAAQISAVVANPELSKDAKLAQLRGLLDQDGD